MGKPSTSDVVLPPGECIAGAGGTWGSETSQYPQEKKSNEIAQVAASERALA